VNRNMTDLLAWLEVFYVEIEAPKRSSKTPSNIVRPSKLYPST